MFNFSKQSGRVSPLNLLLVVVLLVIVILVGLIGYLAFQYSTNEELKQKSAQKNNPNVVNPGAFPAVSNEVGRDVIKKVNAPEPTDEERQQFNPGEINLGAGLEAPQDSQESPEVNTDIGEFDPGILGGLNPGAF